MEIKENFDDAKSVKIASDILNMSRNTLSLNLRYMDKAISMLSFEVAQGEDALKTDGRKIFYDPNRVIRSFKEDPALPAREYLHMVLHGIYAHFWVSALVNKQLWDLSCDIAAESTINELNIYAVKTKKAGLQREETEKLRGEVKFLTADKLYKYFMQKPPKHSEYIRLKELFEADVHDIWYTREIRLGTDGSGGIGSSGSGLLKEWQDAALKMKVALDTFMREKGDGAGALKQNLNAVTREKYDYSSFLKKFAVRGESMKVNNDEFDYIFYTYGLKVYGNVPLIEPLEYRDEKQIKEFAIAIDTSGSTSGELVQNFLNKTYNILKQQESFARRFNLHIIQCDARIQEDAVITNQDEFDEYIKKMKIKGLGETDFRPVFSYVDELISKKHFTNLKGLIYFTDGYGTFPEIKPQYETAFVFIDDGYDQPEVPVWAIKLVLAKEEIEKI